MQQLLASGNEAVVYDGSHRLDWTDETVQELANLIRTYPVYAWNVASDDRFVDVFSLIPEEERQHVTGIVSSRDELPRSEERRVGKECGGVGGGGTGRV